jgi:hypothetical protein
MRPLTLQEVIDRINSNSPFRKETQSPQLRTLVESPHRPEFYVPRLARVFFSLLLGA